MSNNVLIIGSGNPTSKHLINLLLKAESSVTAVYRKTSPAIGSKLVREIQGGVTKDSPSNWMQGCDVVVYLAGGDASQENAVDNIGAAKAAEAADICGVCKFIYVSALGAHDPNSWGERFRTYLEARAKGEEAIKKWNLNWTILRPGILNDLPGTGKISTVMTEEGDPNISRADVAKTIACVIENDSSNFKTFDVVSGRIPVSVAIDKLSDSF